MKRMTGAKWGRLIDRLRGRPVAVIGDLILDAYVWGQAQRISQEAPVPVVNVTGESEGLGGAANVAENLAALGGRPRLVGVVGDDAAGRRMRSLLAKKGIAVAGLVSDGSRPTTTKTRIIAQSQQVVRVDREVRAAVSDRVRARLFDRLTAACAGCGILLLSDYAKGVFSDGFIRELIAYARRRGLAVFVDPKVEHFRQYRGATVLTPNVPELTGGVGRPLPDEPALVAAGREVVRDLALEALLITRGADGMLLVEGRRPPFSIPTVAKKVFDVSGAGDTVISVLALARAAGASFPEAAYLANHAAGIVVGKLGAATVTPAELKAVVRGG